MNKVCPVCLVDKSQDQYWKGQYLCIECQKFKQKHSWESRTPEKRLEQHLKYKYGVTHEAFMQRWQQQNGCCEICNSNLPDLMSYEKRRRAYAIDHNHETGEFRGILCVKCNSLLGMANDSEVILQSAITYLRKNGTYAECIDNMRAARKK
jgi:hypothetical protein